MTPIGKDLLIYRGIEFTFFIVLRDQLSTIGTITADPATNIITSSVAHGLIAGDPVQFATQGGNLPFPILAGTQYWVISAPSSTTFSISQSYQGPEFDIATSGAPTNYLYTNRAINLTGWQVWAWVKDSPTGTLVMDLNPTIVSPASQGKIDMSMTDEQTILLTAGNHSWDMVLQDPTGVRIGPLFQGGVTIIHLITEPPE
jgi:hypothetical protein